MIRALAAAGLIAATATPALAQPVVAPGLDDPRRFGDALMQTVVEKGAGGFLDRILAETPLGDDDAARRGIQDNRPRWVREVEALGTVIDYQYAGQRAYAPALRTLCYVARFRRAPLLFSLRFYQTPRGWNLVTYSWNTIDRIRDWDCYAATPVAMPAMDADAVPVPPAAVEPVPDTSRESTPRELEPKP